MQVMRLHLQLSPDMNSLLHHEQCLLTPKGMINDDEEISDFSLQILKKY